MSGETTEILDSGTFYERLEKALSKARAGQTVSLYEMEARIIARITSEFLSTALENPDPEAVLLAIRDVVWVHLSPAARPSISSAMKVLDTLGIRSLGTTPQPSDGRWVIRIGSRGRLTLPENLLYEMSWRQGDSLLLQGVEPCRLSIRRVVRVAFCPSSNPVMNSAFEGRRR